jgi:urea transport system permease protein
LAALLVIFSGALAVADESAGPSESMVNSLAAKKFGDKRAAIEALAALGDERVIPVFEAMVDGNLWLRKSDGKVVVAEKQGSVYVLQDPLTLAEIGQVEKSEIKSVRANNKLRRMIRQALGGLTLMSADPARRMVAADAVFRAQSADAIPALETALERENDSGVASRMERALAANRLMTTDDIEVRLTAIETLGDHADPEVQALLASVLVKGETEGLDESIVAAVNEALESVEQKLFLWGLVGDLFFGVSLGSVLLLCAVGLAITFGVMGVINMAHGELMMIGAYTTFIIQEIFRAYLPEGAFDYSMLIAVPAAFLISGVFGIAIERGIIRWLYGRPLETLLATWGLSLILQQMVRTIWGPTNQRVSPPSFMSGAMEFASGLTLTYNRIWIIIFSLTVLALIGVLLRKTTFGLRMRAVTQNRRMASSMGIRTGAIDALTFGLGAGVAGLGGVALSQIDNVSPNLGQTYIVDSFLVVVFGGVGNLWGTLVGAFTLGVINKFLEPLAGAVLGKIFVLIFIIIFIQRRPRGLFALKGRFVES